MHQTHHASRSVRTSQPADTSQPSSADGGSSAHAVSLRQEIVHSFYTNLKKVQNRGGMAGEARDSRWKENQEGRDELAARGNAGNAAAVATAKAREVCILFPERSNIF